MKIQIVSDLHLEFNTDITVNNAGAEVLILSGDICVAEHLHRNPPFNIDIHGNVMDLNDVVLNKDWYGHDAKRYRKFFEHVSKEFDVVFYVMGNHEHYQGRWDRTASALRETLEPYDNVYLLDDEWINFNGVRFAGSDDYLEAMAARKLVLDTIAKHTGTQTRVDAVRLLWGGAKWNYQFDGDA